MAGAIHCGTAPAWCDTASVSFIVLALHACVTHASTRRAFVQIHVPAERVASKWYGEEQRNLGAVFDAADSVDGGCIVFIDEVEALAPARGQMGTDSQATNKVCDAAHHHPATPISWYRPVVDHMIRRRLLCYCADWKASKASLGRRSCAPPTGRRMLTPRC